jgi:D-glycero-D-manno-heptose 1,7-bisphosphate phosphatase
VSARAAVFLDRDGVLNELVPDLYSGLHESPLSPSEVRLVPGAASALGRLRGAGYALVAVTNQPAAAKGRVSVQRLQDVQDRVRELLAADGAALDAWRMCLHHPASVVPELSGPCECRKPAPGMLLDAARELDLDLERSWIVGDTDSDVEAGRAAGCRTALIVHPGSAHKRAGSAALHKRDETAAPGKRAETASSDVVARDLGHVSAVVLGMSDDRVPK